jgi:hypothetical protein
MKGLLLLFIVFFSVGGLYAQNQQAQTPGAQLAHHIADKMADTLGLTNQQRAKVFTINMELDRRKSEARAKSPDRAVMGKELQKIETGRDALYKSVLTEEQYTLYLQKKRHLVSRN